eukprot:6194942-Alexandrium_andersonii.AAC.1
MPAQAVQRAGLPRQAARADHRGGGPVVRHGSLEVADAEPPSEKSVGAGRGANRQCKGGLVECFLLIT